MNRRSRLAGQLAMLALVGLLVVAFPGGFALAQDLADPGATTQSNHTLVPIINLTSTPTETPTATPTQTATPTPTATASPTATSDGGGDGGGGDTSGDGRRLVVDKGSGPDGGVTSEADCSNANYTTIQRAVDDAARGDTVVVCAGDGQYKPTNPIEITTPITLRAKGDAEIATTEQTAIRTTAPGVTIRGFTFDHTVLKSQRFAIEVGGRNTMVRNNSFELTGNSSGILLSDGLEPETGEPDPRLGPATGSRVVNNVLNESDLSPYGIFTDADGTVIHGNSLYPRGDNSIISIKSTGNRTVIRANTIIHQTNCPTQSASQPGSEPCNYTNETILIGGDNNPKRGASNSLCGNPEPNSEITSPPGHTWARNNRLVDNYIAKTPGSVRVASRGNYSKIFTAYAGVVVKNNILRNTSGIGIFTKDGVVRNNTVAIGETKSGETPPSEKPQKGGAQAALCFQANNTNVTGNHLAGFVGGVSGHGSNNTIKNNIVKNNGGGIKLNNPRSGREHDTTYSWHARGNRIINNTVIKNGGSKSIKIRTGVTELSYNTVSNNRNNVGFSGGIVIQGQRGGFVINFHHNKITNNSAAGIRIVGNVTKLHHNTITGNDEAGIVIKEGFSDVSYDISSFHHNLIDNNGGLGINRENYDKTDGEWPILNATHNIWGCGGPSGGLRDPKTNRTANGSGDGLSAGDDPGVSNIRFDPFFVRQDVTCPTGRSNPTPTPTPPTPTKTPTPTPAPTPPAPESGNGSGTGGSGGSGTGGSGGSGTGGSGGSGTGGSGGSGNTGNTGAPSDNTPEKPATATPSPATATLSPTSTPTPTISPTPKVEPGFGVLTWLIGTIILIALLIRRRLPLDTEDTHD